MIVSEIQNRPRRQQVLDTLREAAAPLGVAEVAERIQIHPNTARFHLDALAGENTVERTLEQPSGPGRPRTVYAPRPGMDRSGARSYRLLAQILLSHLSAGPEAGEAAAQAGRAWGRFLIDRPSPFQHLTAEDAAARLTTLLEDLEFAPEPRGTTSVPEMIRLRHCPFLELAEEYGTLVCQIHLGLMQGALAELQASVTVNRLEPFAEPDACLAHLRRADAA